jgi:carbonic anhydrase
MEKILSFNSPREHYTADACIVWCFDDRFSGLLNIFAKDLKNYDLVKVAGGAKALAGEATPERDFVLDQIKKSIALHGTKKVILMLHRDCGAYGGSKSFADLDTETKNQTEQLAAAKQFLANEIPDVPIETDFAEFDGLYKI